MQLWLQMKLLLQVVAWAIFVCLMVVVIVCCEEIWENAHIKFPIFESFNSNAWLEFECLDFIRVLQSLYHHLKIKAATTEFRSYFSFSYNNKETQSFKVNSTSGLVKSLECVSLVGCQQKIESCNFNPEKKKGCIEHSIMHKSWNRKMCLVLR